MKGTVRGKGRRSNWGRAMSALALASLGMVPAVSGCDTAPESTAKADAVAGDAVTADQTSDSLGNCPFTRAAPASSPIVINEVQGKGDDWIELHNKSGATVSLAGYSVADQNELGCPDLLDGVAFPADATIAAGGYILVEAGKTTPEIGLTTKCIQGGPETCYQAAFKVSAAGGDKVFLTLNKTVVDTVSVPPNVLLDGTQTWGRLPNGTGEFKSAVPTPGAANK